MDLDIGGKFVNWKFILFSSSMAACAALLGGCASTPTAAVEQNVYWQRVAASLQQSTQLRERMFAANLLGLGVTIDEPSAQQASEKKPVSANPASLAAARALIAEAEHADDPLALSLATHAASTFGDHALASRMAARWQAVEADNLVPRLYTSVPMANLLSGARDTSRYDTHGYDQVRLMASVFTRFPMTREETGSNSNPAYSNDALRAGANAFGIWFAVSTPAFQALTNECKGPALEATPTRREDCLHVAKVMAGDPSDLLSKGLGISMLERAAITPEDIALATALRRNKEWQQPQYFAAFIQGKDEQEQISDMLRLLNTPGVGNEIQMMEAALREKGIPLTPPTDWQPHIPD